MRGTGPARPITERLGLSTSTPNGDNDRPYGKCYGQVGGVSYPCTQKVVEKDSDESGKDRRKKRNGR